MIKPIDQDPLMVKHMERMKVMKVMKVMGAYGAAAMCLADVLVANGIKGIANEGRWHDFKVEIENQVRDFMAEMGL